MRNFFSKVLMYFMLPFYTGQFFFIKFAKYSLSTDIKYRLHVCNFVFGKISTLGGNEIYPYHIDRARLWADSGRHEQTGA